MNASIVNPPNVPITAATIIPEETLEFGLLDDGGLGMVSSDDGLEPEVEVEVPAGAG